MMITTKGLALAGFRPWSPARRLGMP